MEKGSCKSAQPIQTEPWNCCCTQNENLRTEKGHVNRHNQFRPNRGTIVALKMKIYERKKDHVNRHNQFRPNRGTVVALKMKIYERKKVM